MVRYKIWQLFVSIIPLRVFLPKILSKIRLYWPNSLDIQLIIKHI